MVEALLALAWTGDFERDPPKIPRKNGFFHLESVLDVLECDPPIWGDICVGLVFVFEFVIDGSVF